MIRRSFFKALSTLAALPVVGKLLPEPESQRFTTDVWFRVNAPGVFTNPEIGSGKIHMEPLCFEHFQPHLIVRPSDV
jgi:hypothetical protein